MIRNGEFYETYGVDSVMLIAYCGLNPMGGKIKAGCPIQNIQSTLDGLTSEGLSVAGIFNCLSVLLINYTCIYCHSI